MDEVLARRLLLSGADRSSTGAVVTKTGQQAG
jgi:hypothetical protein